MNWLLDILDRLRAAYRARRSAQAQADLQAGKDILDQAQREAAEMRAAADAAEARKRLDTELSGVPIVPAAPAPGVAAIAPAEVAPVPGSAAAGPDADTARIRKP
mgnify:CR=1 FL=1